MILLCFAAMGSVAQAPAPAVPAAEEKPLDPLGRLSPRSSLTNFLKTAGAGKYDRAAQYLDMPASQQATRGVALAKQLQAVMNNGYLRPLSEISDREQGRDEEGLPSDQENAGDIAINGETVSLIMVRMERGGAGSVWLVSRETLREIPSLSAKITVFSMAESLPDELHAQVFGMALYQWIAAAVLLIPALALAWIIAKVGVRILHRFGAEFPKTPWVVIVLLALFLHGRILPLLQVPLLLRSNYARVIAVLLLAAFAWLVMRAVDATSVMAQHRAVERGNLSASSWIILVRRLLKFVVFVIAVLILFSMFGFNVTTALAGLGIGGIAIGFGAQKTIENLFGGISVATDQVIRVGDTCDLGGRVGTITDIGLRSTRMRTLERTELSVPNGVLASMNVENLTKRDKFLFRTTIGLLYETTSAQVAEVVDGIRKLLETEEKVEWPGGRVNFVSFGENSLDVEMFVYILAPDFNEFIRIREDLLLKIMAIVETAKTGFAFPSRTVYLKRDGSELLQAAAPGKSDTP